MLKALITQIDKEQGRIKCQCDSCYHETWFSFDELQKANDESRTDAHIFLCDDCRMRAEQFAERQNDDWFFDVFNENERMQVTMDNKNYYICIMADGKFTMMNAAEIEMETESREDCRKILFEYKCKPFSDADTGVIEVWAKETTFDTDGREMLTGVCIAGIGGSSEWIDVKPVPAQQAAEQDDDQTSKKAG